MYSQIEMGEVKSVKVDNWGVFFLQKLQNFFNKTDYCDLTLQFRDNSQLKVHRLVLSACTDYFNVLEQQCESVDDVLIMPIEFQADVVVPIVNFMYTGTLEFELKMYGKLLRTAKEMNMTVLLKLLEAHRRTMENVNRQQRPPSPKGIRRTGRSPMQISPQRSLMSQKQQMGQQNQSQIQIRRPLEPQRSPSLLRANASSQTQMKQEASTSPFEQLRKGYNNNKRPANTTILSVPSKKPNLEDVKEYAEQQRMRKQIAAEYGDDHEYETGMMDEDIHADDDDDEAPQQIQQPTTSRHSEAGAQTGQTTRVEHGGATLLFKQESPGSQPTIIVKDSSNTRMSHAKIISEVLRQYPHLMKGQKNLKLKIMPNTSSATSTSPSQKIMKKELDIVESNNSSTQLQRKQPLISPKQTERSFLTNTTAATVLKTHTSSVGLQKELTSPQKIAGSIQPVSGTTTGGAAAGPPKRRIDSKTMHALIALGAENTTGPWLCLRCGINGRPISIPSYRSFRRHLVHTHKESIDPALCEHCGWRSQDNRQLHLHILNEHKLDTNIYVFPECKICNVFYSNNDVLSEHINEVHSEVNKQQCIYCNRIFAKEMLLYTHMKSQHKEQALEDGIIDETDEEYFGSQDEEDVQPIKKDSRIKILSDISLPAVSTNTLASKTIAKPELTNLQEFLQSSPVRVSSNEIKFVGPDGNEVDLTEEQRRDILSQLNRDEHAEGGVVMVLNETDTIEETDNNMIADGKTATGIEESSMVMRERGDSSPVIGEYDDSQIFNELNVQSGSSGETEVMKKNENAHFEESKESIENLEWAENLISEHERASEAADNEEQKKIKNTNLSDKLKELTCDWTEDENEDEVEAETKPAATNATKSKELDKKSEENAASTSVQAMKGSRSNSTETVTEKVDKTSNIVKKEELKMRQQQEMEVDLHDDIDLALQNLHKESTMETESLKEDIKIENVKVAETDVKTAVDEKPIKVENNILDTLKTEILDEKEPEEFNSGKRTIKLEKKPSKEIEDKIASEGGTADDHLETDKIRKTLLDELIAEAGNASGMGAIKNEEREGHIIEADEIKTEEKELKIKDDENTTKKLQSVAAESKETVKDSDNNNAIHALDVMNTEASTSAGHVEKQKNATDNVEQSASASNGSKSRTVAVTVAAVGTDKVKSIISDWVDDDDDEDDVGGDIANNGSVADVDDDKVKEEL